MALGLSNNGKRWSECIPDGPGAAPLLDFIKINQEEICVHLEWLKGSRGNARRRSGSVKPEGLRLPGATGPPSRACHMHQRECTRNPHLLFSIAPPRPERPISGSCRNVLTNAQELQPLTTFKHPVAIAPSAQTDTSWSGIEEGEATT